MNLTVNAIDSWTNQLKWDRVVNAESYDVYRDGAYLGTTTATARADNLFLIPGTNPFYGVAARDPEGQIITSSKYVWSPLPPPPSDPTPRKVQWIYCKFDGYEITNTGQLDTYEDTVSAWFHNNSSGFEDLEEIESPPITRLGPPAAYCTFKLWQPSVGMDLWYGPRIPALIHALGSTPGVTTDPTAVKMVVIAGFGPVGIGAGSLKLFSYSWAAPVQMIHELLHGRLHHAGSISLIEPQVFDPRTINTYSPGGDFPSGVSGWTRYGGSGVMAASLEPLDPYRKGVLGWPVRDPVFFPGGCNTIELQPDQELNIRYEHNSWYSIWQTPDRTGVEVCIRRDRMAVGTPDADTLRAATLPGPGSEYADALCHINFKDHSTDMAVVEVAT